MKQLIQDRLREREEQDEASKAHARREEDTDFASNQWPPFWPILTREWPLGEGVAVVRTYQLLPPRFLLSDGSCISGEFMINVIRAAFVEGNLAQVTDAMKMEALHQILLYGNPRNSGPDLAANVAFLLHLKCPVNGNKVYGAPLEMILRKSQPQQLKIIKLLIAAGADCERACEIANSMFDNLWEMICLHSA